MSDERFLRGFRAFDAAVAPDAAFAERLFAELADELGLRAGEAATAPAVAAPVTARVRRLFRLDWRPLPPAQMRLVYLAAVVALLAAALAGSALVASQLLRSHPSPLDIVRQSQAAVADPPPFVLVYRNATGQEATFANDGNGTWRSDETDGSYGLWDGSRQGLYDAQGKAWGIVDVPVTQAPFTLLMDIWSWTSTAVPGSEGVPIPIDCADAVWVEEATVAGRATDRIRCPSWYGTEVWIDRESHLVLKYVAGPEAPGWTGEMPPDVVMRGIEAVSLDLSPPQAAAFSWDGPIGAYDMSNPPPSTVLAVGAPAPAWTGATVDGTSLTLPAPGRPTAVLFADTWCFGGCRPGYDALAEAFAAHPEIQAAVAMSRYAGSAAGYRELHPTTVPLVADPDRALSGAWGVGLPDTLVLIDSSGTVRAMTTGRETGDRLRDLVDALAAGEPLPSAAPSPTAAPEAEPTPFTTPGPHEVMADWSGRLLDGTSLTAADLRGRPTVLYLTTGLQGQGESLVDPALEAFGAALPAIRDRANVVLLIGDEWTPGSFAALLARLGIEAPTIGDWDNTVLSVIGASVGFRDGFSTLVFDGDGRLVTVVATPSRSELVAALDVVDSGALPPLPTPMP